MIRQTRGFEMNDGVKLFNDPAHLVRFLEDDFHELPAFASAIFRSGIREPSAYISKRQRTENSVDDGMQKHVAIRMRFHFKGARNGQSANEYLRRVLGSH